MPNPVMKHLTLLIVIRLPDFAIKVIEWSFNYLLGAICSSTYVGILGRFYSCEITNSRKKKKNVKNQRSTGRIGEGGIE